MKMETVLKHARMQTLIHIFKIAKKQMKILFIKYKILKMIKKFKKKIDYQKEIN